MGLLAPGPFSSSWLLLGVVLSHCIVPGVTSLPARTPHPRHSALGYVKSKCLLASFCPHALLERFSSLPPLGVGWRPCTSSIGHLMFSRPRAGKIAICLWHIPFCPACPLPLPSPPPGWPACWLGHLKLPSLAVIAQGHPAPASSTCCVPWMGQDKAALGEVDSLAAESCLPAQLGVA